MPTPEEQARELIDHLLVQAGWVVQSYREMNLGAGEELALTEFSGAHGLADYLLYADGQAFGVVEAKPVGPLPRGIEGQSASYSNHLPADLPACQWPLPSIYESTSEITQFMNRLEPHARSREIFSFHRPAAIRELVKQGEQLRTGLRKMPELMPERLWPAHGDCQSGTFALVGEAEGLERRGWRV